MENFLGLLIVVVAVGAFLYFKNAKVKEFINSRISDKPEKPIGGDQSPAEPVFPSVNTPAPTQPEKPVIEPPVKPEGEYNGVGDPPSQEAWTRWRNSLDFFRRLNTPEVWKPVDKVPEHDPIDTNSLIRGIPLHPAIPANFVLTLPIEREATRLSIAPKAGGIGNTYALYITDETGKVLAGDPNKPLFEVSSIVFPASDKPRWANIRNFGQETSLFVQAN